MSTTFHIRINVTDPRFTFGSYFVCLASGVRAAGTPTIGWDSNTAHDLSLEPGEWHMQFQSGIITEWFFKVTPAGTIEIPPLFATGFMTATNPPAPGVPTLTITSFPITLDPTGLTGSSVATLIWNVKPSFARINQVTVPPVKLTPQKGNLFEQGSSTVDGNFTFEVDLNGIVHYPVAWEYNPDTNRGFFQGRGTKMLKFVGCLVTFDGRRCNGMTHASIDGPPNYPLLQTSALLPSMSGYLIFLDGNPSTHTNVIIQVDANGHITASGPGKARVKIVQPIIDPVTQIQTPAVVIGLP